MPSPGDVIPDDQVKYTPPTEEASASPRSGFFAKKPKAGTVIPDDQVNYAGNDLGGSVFDTNKSRLARVLDAPATQAAGGAQFAGLNAVNKGKAIVKEAGPVAAGMVPIIAGAAMGPESMLGKMAVQGVASVAQTLIQHETAKFLGEPSESPTFNDFSTNAAINVGMSMLHIPIPGSMKAVGPEMDRVMAKNQVTASEARAALLKRDVLKQSGMSDADIDKYYDHVNKNPSALDVDAANVQTAQRAKSFYYDVKQTINNRFSNEFAALPHQDAPASPETIDQIGNDVVKMSRDPTSRVTPYIQKTIQSLSGEPLTVNGQPVPPELAKRFQATQDAPSFTVSNIRRLITDARENLPANATPMEKAEMSNWTKQLNTQYEAGMKGANATDQDIITARDTYRRYGQAAETLKALDPKAPDFGKKVSDIVFGEAKNNPEVGLKFANMVAEVDKLKPGTMAQFRQGILNQFLDESKKGAGGGPMHELQNLAAIQRKVAEFGPNDEGRAFLKATFGEGPMADPKEFSKVVRGITDPEVHKKSVATVQQVGRTVAGVPMLGWATRMMAISGIAYGVTGKQQSPFRSLLEWPTNAIIIGTALVGGPIATKFLGAGGPIQRAYVSYLTKPSPEALQMLVHLTGHTIGAATAGVLTEENSQAKATPPPQAYIP